MSFTPAQQTLPLDDAMPPAGCEVPEVEGLEVDAEVAGDAGLL